MKLLSLCDPTQYKRPPLDVPTFYRQLASDSRVQFYHMPSPWALSQSQRLPVVEAIATPRSLPYAEFVTLGDRTSQLTNLEEIDLVFCRTLKPYAPDYLTKLSRWEAFTTFVNSPSHKCRQMEADFLLSVAAPYMSETIVTDHCSEARAFFETHQVVVAKTENSTGGRGVFKIFYESGEYCVDNILTGLGRFSQFSHVMRFLQSASASSRLRSRTSGQSSKIQFSRYLANTSRGDKRVVVVDGEIYGSYLRKSQSGHWVNNVSADGQCSLADVSAVEKDAIARTVGHYQRMGLHTLGYDFLMDDEGTWRISEINAGNIGGFARLEMLTGQPIMAKFIDWLLTFSEQKKREKQPILGLFSQASHMVAAAL